jgi:hypothetical protein
MTEQLMAAGGHGEVEEIVEVMRPEGDERAPQTTVGKRQELCADSLFPFQSESAFNKYQPTA